MFARLRHTYARTSARDAGHVSRQPRDRSWEPAGQTRPLLRVTIRIHSLSDSGARLPCEVQVHWEVNLDIARNRSSDSTCFAPCFCGLSLRFTDWPNVHILLPAFLSRTLSPWFSLIRYGCKCVKKYCMRYFERLIYNNTVDVY